MKKLGRKRQRAAAKAPRWVRDIAAAHFDPVGVRRHREAKLGTFGAASEVRHIDPNSRPLSFPAANSPALAIAAPGSTFTRSATLAGSDGNPSTPSPEADGAKMGHHPDRVAQAVVKSVNSGQAVEDLEPIASAPGSPIIGAE